MRRRCGSFSSVALLLLLVCFFLHCSAATARSLPLVPAPAQLLQQEKGVKAADGLELQEGAAVGNNGDALSTSTSTSTSEVMGAEEVEEEAPEACGEAGDDDECLQRRLLRDAHLDYIYTQHKGKP